MMAHMDLMLILAGFAALSLGWLLMFRREFLLRVNGWLRANVFNDRFVIFSRRRVAVLLLMLGCVATFSGIDGLVDEQPVKPNIANFILEKAHEDFQSRRYRQAVRRCSELVRSNPKNVDAWKLLAAAHWSMGERKQATQAVDAVRRLDPSANFDDAPLLKIIERNMKAPQHG